MDYYIYYKVKPEHVPALKAKIDALQKQFDCPSRLAFRPELRNGLYTWMEVYLNVADDFEARMAQALSASDVLAYIEGERMIERFSTQLPCA